MHSNCSRWSFLLALLLVGVAMASDEEDSIPDVGVEEDSDELALDQEVRNGQFPIFIHFV